MHRSDAIHNKYYALPHLLQMISVWRFQNKKIVFTNGCFDILHRGHTFLLQQASDLAENGILIVGLNTDDSVKRLKGEHRPVNVFEDRAEVLANIYTVDAVIGFEEDTPIHLIEAILPDFLVKGGDYQPENVVGADVVKKNGGEVVIIPFIDGFSTTEIIKRSTT